MKYEYKVKQYENVVDFEEGLNEMSKKGYTLHSFQNRPPNCLIQYVAVFVKDISSELGEL